MEVKLETHTGEQDSPAGKVTIDHPIWRVYVVDAKLKGPPCNSPTGYLQVGYIGKQDGANFCPISSFYRFVGQQQEFIVNEAKRIHGNASDAPIVDVPPPLPDEDEEFE